MKNPLLVALAIIVISGCTETSRNKNDEDISPADSTETTDPDLKVRAIAAKDDLFKQLSERLMQAMTSGGPAAAIDVCSKEAQEIAGEVSKKHGLQIGRTSFKLRNQNNTPPDWAAEMIEARLAEPQFVSLPEGEFGALLPIRLKAQCLLCHGPKEQLDESIITMLEKLYPNDEATGFDIDELRGWFWVRFQRWQVTSKAAPLEFCNATSLNMPHRCRW